MFRAFVEENNANRATSCFDDPESEHESRTSKIFARILGCSHFASPHSSPTTMTDDARMLLKATSWFANVSDALLDALVAKMTVQDVEEGHIFVQEGLPMKHVLILESGILRRTKRPPPSHVRRASLQEIRKEDDPKEAVLVDEIDLPARVTGLLHAIQDLDGNAEAFATVSSAGPARVWSIPGDALRDILASDASFALQVCQAMATELRSGSKSLRSLVQTMRAKGKPGSSSESSHICRVLCYDATSWVTDGFEAVLKDYPDVAMDFTTERLSEQSATYAAGYDAVCLFVNDDANASILQTLSQVGVRMVTLRSAGFDRVDTRAAKAFGLTVTRVPAYSPYAVAEMAVALLLAVNRKIAKASQRVKMANFTLDAGLLGMDLHAKTVGVMGTGKIGQLLVKILLGFGSKVICFDVFEADAVKEMGATYVSKDELYEQSDVIFLMMPLLPATKHTINESVLPKLKPGVLLINTSRGGLVDTKALLKGLRAGIFGGVGMDVYENEAQYFFQDWSARKIEDPALTELLGHHDVVLTAHQAFFTQEAVTQIVKTTMENLDAFWSGQTGFDHPNNCLPSD